MRMRIRGGPCYKKTVSPLLNTELYEGTVAGKIPHGQNLLRDWGLNKTGLYILGSVSTVNKFAERQEQDGKSILANSLNCNIRITHFGNNIFLSL
jgi:hypothetical protein